MKKLFLIIFLLLIPFVRADSFNEVCQEVYFFSINHLDSSNNLTYSSLDLSNLKLEINSKYNLNYNDSEINKNILNFSECSKKIGKEIPSPKINIKSLDLINFSKECKNKNIIPYSILGYDMENSVPIPEISLGTSCPEYGLGKLFFKYDYSDNFNVSGIKLWWIILAFFAIFIYEVVATNSWVRVLAHRINNESIHQGNI